MIIATLCSSNNSEPWGANVPFEIKDGALSTKLKPEYMHYKNLNLNPNAVIVYKADDLELIIKAEAVLNEPDGGVSTAVFKPSWMRVVEENELNDLENAKKIKSKLIHYIGH